MPSILALGLIVVVGVGLRAEDWPQWRGPDRLGIWTESGIVERFPEGGLHTVWRVPVGGGFAGPAVADGRVFVLDYEETPGSRTMDGTERLVCLDEETGDILWTQQWPTTYRNIVSRFANGPRATPTVDGDRVFVLGAGGMLLSLDTATGNLAWGVDTVVDYGATVPVFGMSNAPLVEGDRLIALIGGEPDALIVAFDKTTGEEVWRALPATAETGYSQPIVIEAGGRRQLIVWHAVALTSLDPETGDVYWNQDWAIGGGMAIATPVWSGSYLLVSHFFNGSMMMSLNNDRPDAQMLWRGQSRSELPDQTEGLHAIISTPTILGDQVYGIGSYGELRGLDARTGERLWESAELTPQERWSTAYIVSHPARDQLFVSSEDGDLVIAEFTPAGYVEIDRTPLIERTTQTRGGATGRWGDRPVQWVHPAFANRHIVVRNDEAVIRVSLAAEDY